MLKERPAGPVVAASDYMKTFADQIRPFVPKDRVYRVLGTDGFGRSDSRAKLRHFFEVNRYFVAIAALKALADQGEGKAKAVADAIKKYGIDPGQGGPDDGMSQVVVPDIGDFKEVEVIEVLVKPGDAVTEGAVAHHARIGQGDDGDSVAGGGRGASELKIKVGDKVSKGSPILVLEDKGNGEDRARGEAEAAAAAAKPEPAKPAGGAMTVPVPDIGDFKEVEVIEVLVKPGDAVAKEQSLITLESDKATMEIPSPAAGVVKDLKVKVGDKVSKGSPILVLDSTEAAPAPRRRRPKRRKPRRRSRPAPRRAARLPHAPRPVPREPRDETVRQAARQPVGAQVRARARRRPRRGAGQRPEGPHPARGRAGLREGRSVGRRRPGRRESGRRAAVQPAGLAGGRLRQVRPDRDRSRCRASRSSPGPYLHRNWISIPHVTQFDEADITDLEAFRKAQTVETEKKGFKLTMLAFMIKACVTALKQFPQFNSSLDKSGENLIIKKYYHIGVAVDTPGGLVVPVVRDADRKGVFDIAQRARRDLQARARRQAQARRHAGRHLLDLEPRRHRRHRLHADHQRARSRDPRRVARRDAAGVERQGVRAAPDAAALALLRPPRHRRRHRGALHRVSSSRCSPTSAKLIL